MVHLVHIHDSKNKYWNGVVSKETRDEFTSTTLRQLGELSMLNLSAVKREQIIFILNSVTHTRVRNEHLVY